MRTELNNILCKNEIELFESKLIKDGWVVVSRYEPNPEFAICSAFADNMQTIYALGHYEFDIQPSSSSPYFSEDEVDNGEPQSSYHRFGNGRLEPLIYWRTMPFCDTPDYCEISQEFLLFHHLHEKQEKSSSLWHRKYVSYSEVGEEEECVIVDGLDVRIKVKLLKEYLWARKINLLIFVERFVFSKKSYVELGINGTTYNEVTSGGDYVYIYSQLPDVSYRSDHSKSGANICGKCVIRFSKPMISSEDKYEEFIIGTDAEGNEILSTCHGMKLKNNFGANKDAPDSMSLVFFKKEVLDKYYANPDKYEVRDGYLNCDGAWGLHMDNNNPDYVVAFLYKLGEMPYKEQQYWRQYNIPRPDNGKLSLTASVRNICGHFCDPISPDLKFKQRFSEFNRDWGAKFGWPLFLPLTKEDIHRERTLHSLTKENNDQEFDEQILSLAKLTIDSLNEKELSENSDMENESVRNYLSKKGGKVNGGIDKFMIFMLSKGIDTSEHTPFLRNVYALRSQDIAHRKSSKQANRKHIADYFDFDNKTKREVLDSIFIKFVSLFHELSEATNA